MKDSLLLIWFIVALFTSFLIFTAVAHSGDGQFNIFNANALTGGGQALDGINSNTYLDSGDLAITAKLGVNIYFHIYNETTTSAENSPNIIIPNDNVSGSGAWVLTYAYSQQGSERTVSMILLDDETALSAGDGFADLPFYIPSSLNGWKLTEVSGAVGVSSISGKPTFQIHNVTTGVDLLTTKLTIDENELHSTTAIDTPTINPSYQTVVTGDKLRFDCDVAGTGAKGVQLDMIFTQ